MNRQDEKAEIGLWLLKEFWGQGIMKEVMPKLFEAGFEQLGLNRIEGFVMSQNEKCKKALVLSALSSLRFITWGRITQRAKSQSGNPAQRIYLRFFAACLGKLARISALQLWFVGNPRLSITNNYLVLKALAK